MSKLGIGGNSGDCLVNSTIPGNRVVFKPIKVTWEYKSVLFPGAAH